MNLRILQRYMVLLTIIEVRSNTQSINICPDNTDGVEVKIETDDVLFAGTDSHASLLLRSGRGIICQVHNLDNIENDRERNSIDKYTIYCSKYFLDKDLMY